jgi:hypothetical protein
LSTFETWIQFGGLHSACGVITKGLLKHFVSLRSYFLKVKTVQILCSLLRSVISLGYNDHRMLHPIQRHLNISCTKMKLPVAVTPHYFTINQFGGA